MLKRGPCVRAQWLGEDANIVSDIELIPVQQVNTAYERMLKGDVKYRFVLDMKTL